MLNEEGDVKYVNMFAYSIPFISEKIIDIIVNIYKHLESTEDHHISND